MTIMDLLKASNVDWKAYEETIFAVQEWGIKNNLRLFGITVAEYGEPGKPRAKAYFTDTHFKNIMMIFFDIKKTGGKVTVSKEKLKGTKWPIKFARTKWESHNVDPVNPLYQVLVDRKIILPFMSTMKEKEWAALPFEDMAGMKPTKIREGTVSPCNDPMEVADFFDIVERVTG